MNPIGVGIIGASPDGGWAQLAHVPAIAALPEYELRAVGTSRRASADAAAAVFGVPGFDDHHDLLARPDVDLVVVSVKVPHHHRLIVDALAAGKAVYSEWPLGRDLAEAQDLTDRATQAGARTAIGLQARFSPAIVRARELVAGGHVGKVLSTTVVASGGSWGPETDGAHKYLFDAANGVTVLSVTALHALDAVAFVLGEIVELSAQQAIGRSQVRVVDEDETIAVSAPDQVAVSGLLAGGALLSASFRGSVFRGSNLRWEIHGSEGDLIIDADGPNGNIQVAELRLAVGRGEQAALVPVDDVAAGDGGFAANVRRLYAQLARDIRTGTTTVPGFAHALARHRLMADIEAAAARPVVRTRALAA